MAVTALPATNLQRIPTGIIPLIISGTDASTALLTGLRGAGDAAYQCDIWGFDLYTNGVTDIDFIDSLTGNTITGILGFGASSGPAGLQWPMPVGNQLDMYAKTRATASAGALITMTNSGAGVRVTGTVWVSIRPKG